MNKPVTRGEQWTANSKVRRQKIKDAGGRQVLVMVSPADNEMLNAILAHRIIGERPITLTSWVAKMIRADYLALQRGVKRRGG